MSVKHTIEKLRKERAKPYLEIANDSAKLEIAKKHAEKLVKTKSILKAGNRKLDKSVLIFNLPDAYTCPGASLGCLKFCYAKPAKSNNPRATAIARYARYLLTLRNDFVDIIVKELKSKRTIKAVRIHESGDFYSTAYFRKWIEIAKQLPHITFYAYTKSLFVLTLLEELPDNFVIIYSLDKTNFFLFKKIIEKIECARKNGKRVGISYVNTHEIIDSSNINAISAHLRVFVCPATLKNKEKIKCGRDCTYCQRDIECVMFNVH